MFSSKNLDVDLRYYAETSDQEQGGVLPKIDLELKDFTARGLLGPTVISEFELTAGQTVWFILREYNGTDYKTHEHEEVANPNEARAKELGIDLKTLVRGATALRPAGDPLITKDLLLDTMKVSGEGLTERLIGFCFGIWIGPEGKGLNLS